MAADSTATELGQCLEPFPLCVDSSPAHSPNYFSPPLDIIAALHLLASSECGESRGSVSVSVSSRISNHLRLRYYQYEVTAGLYVMTVTERMVFHTVVLGILAALLYALMRELPPFLVRLVVWLLRAVSGSSSDDPALCSP